MVNSKPTMVIAAPSQNVTAVLGTKPSFNRARAAGMRVIGFTGAGHSYPGHADALTEAGAETVIRRWAELSGTIAALSEWSEDA